MIGSRFLINHARDFYLRARSCRVRDHAEWFKLEFWLSRTEVWASGSDIYKVTHVNKGCWWQLGSVGDQRIDKIKLVRGRVWLLCVRGMGLTLWANVNLEKHLKSIQKRIPNEFESSKIYSKQCSFQNVTFLSKIMDRGQPRGQPRLTTTLPP